MPQLENKPPVPQEQQTKTPQSAAAGKPAPGTPPVRNKYADTMNQKKKRLPKPVKIVLGILVLALLAGGVYWAVKKSAEPPVTTQQTSAFASRGTLETYVEGSGTTASKNQAELGKDIKGKVEAINVSIGTPVSKGTVLMTIDPTETRKELETAMTSLAEAERSLTEAQKSVAGLTVTAPFTGRLLPQGDTSIGAGTDSSEDSSSSSGSVQEIKITAGQEISSGTVLGTLVDDNTMKLQLYFSYAYIDMLKVGAKATVSIPRTMNNLDGTVESVERIEKISDEGSRLFRATISMKNPGTLKAGMEASATVKAGDLNIVPYASGKLSYNREEQLVVKTGGKAATAANPSYYTFNAGQAILRLTSEEANTALKNAQDIVQSRRETVQDLQKKINECTVISPMDGIVLNVTCAEGDTLEGTTVPIVVADLNTIVVNASISSLDIDRVKEGQPATITLEQADGTMTYEGTVLSVSMQAEKTQGGGGNSQDLNFPAVIQVDNFDGALQPDRYINYKIKTASSENCIMVPSSALVNTDSGSAVFAKPAEGQTFENTLPIPEGTDVPPEYFLVPVETGIYDSDNTEILSGLDEGTEVYLAGPKDAYADMNSGEGVAVAVG